MLLEFPQEILIEILVRLPVKSLLRFRVISSSWNSLIESKTFIAQHLSRSIKASDSKIIMRHYDFPRSLHIYAFYCDDGKWFTEDQVLELPFKIKNYQYVGTCNGLFCFYCNTNSYLNIALWNPSIRTCFQIPFPRFIGKSQGYLVGIGFDHRINQYKVFRLINIKSKKRRCIKELEVEVFVLGTGQWRRLDTHLSSMKLYHFGPYQVYLHNAIHWVGHRPDDSAVIIVFDVHEEAFREIEIPSIIHPIDCCVSVKVCGESLSLLEYGDLETSEEPYRVFVWIMKMYGVKESWAKLFGINMEDQWGCNTVLGFKNNGKLLVVNDGKGLVSYDSKSGRVEQPMINRKNDEILFPNDPKEVASFYLKNGMAKGLGLISYLDAIPHVECLVLLNKWMVSKDSCSCAF